VLFTVGAIFLATRWPDPFPRVFGYHEVWHTLVVAAVVCHLVAIGSVVHGAGMA
jgi:hemolysin III